MVIALGATLFFGTLQRDRPNSDARIDWQTAASEADFDRMISAHSGRPIVIDFHADWCGDCVEMERTVLSQPDIAALIAREFVPIRVDATEDIDKVRGIAERFGAQGVPAFRFLDAGGNELFRHRLDGPADKDAFEGLLLLAAQTATEFAKNGGPMQSPKPRQRYLGQKNGAAQEALK